MSRRWVCLETNLALYEFNYEFTSTVCFTAHSLNCIPFQGVYALHYVERVAEICLVRVLIINIIRQVSATVCVTVIR